MIEISMTELCLLVWAVGASTAAGHFYAQARHRGELLLGASLFIKKIVTHDALRDELREMLDKGDKDVDIKFGMGE
jgi:hypothetical protein